MSQPRLLIIARDDAQAGPLAEGLDRLGWRTVTARAGDSALAVIEDMPIEAAIIDLDSGDDLAHLAARFKAAAAPRRLPVIALGSIPPGEEQHRFDLVLGHPVHPAQAMLRIESLVRTAIAEEEFELRRETFAERGKRFTAVEPSAQPYRILAVGEPAPQFLALSNTLKASGVEITGAFTAYTAFDYLHERAFDAVILWAGDNRQEALSIASGLRRNTRLFHIPALLYLGEGAEVMPAEAFHKGVSDVAVHGTGEEETARRMIELARAHRYGEAVRGALDKARSSGLMDAATGLFTRDLFAAHLARQAAAAVGRGRPLSVAVLKIAEKPELAAIRAGGWVDRAVPQIGSMIGRLVRAEDTAARLAPEVFALSLPATSQAQARAAAERIAAVISCTAFDAGDGRKPFVCDFDIGVAQIEGQEGAARALERAAALALRSVAS
ncbi:diguanylate cyclase domain-containing protein [Caulobacter sp. NIBR2454]|uniref:diguanylate cyclase domain-containing protein n=1 Tax=Caulobacter sp. NIBR2454 TaxID=3015996 RepID=UPI0022B666B5|nr:diguanylate cyclase [Caulobacter sp. NIBR2454]